MLLPIAYCFHEHVAPPGHTAPSQHATPPGMLHALLPLGICGLAAPLFMMLPPSPGIMLPLDMMLHLDMMIHLDMMLPLDMMLSPRACCSPVHAALPWACCSGKQQKLNFATHEYYFVTKGFFLIGGVYTFGP